MEKNKKILPLITIITVCFNAREIIESTIESVLSQTYKNIEYIVVDGASTDGTTKVIKKYISNESIDRITLISEPDDGLYYAMNKGVALANGDFVHFLNAGDVYANADVLKQVVGKIIALLGEDFLGNEEKLDKNFRNKSLNVFYGNVIYALPDGREQLRTYSALCGKKIYYLTGDCLNHQGVFAPLMCFRKYQFNASDYRICADREWMMNLSKDGIKFIPLNMTIVKYSLDENSVSIVNDELQWKETEECIKKHYPIGYPVYAMFKFIRNSKVLSKILHVVYEKVFIRE